MHCPKSSVVKSQCFKFYKERAVTFLKDLVVFRVAYKHAFGSGTLTVADQSNVSTALFRFLSVSNKRLDIPACSTREVLV